MKLGDIITSFVGKIKFYHRCVGFTSKGLPIVQIDMVVPAPMAQIMYSHGKERFYIHVLRDGKWGMEHGPFTSESAAQAHAKEIGYDVRKRKRK